ncbi:MAG: hypothetical protein CMM50_01230 [Rhodospirillaceae bacterium]|nr:hypothetical protein [Rhodospirillaceae bacterium]
MRDGRRRRAVYLRSPSYWVAISVRVRGLTAAGPCSAAGIDVLDTALGVDLADITIIDCGAAIPLVRAAGSSTIDLGLLSLVGTMAIWTSQARRRFACGKRLRSR